jgi:hypothetical protein
MPPPVRRNADWRANSSTINDGRLSKSVIREINALHGELCVLARTTLSKAIRIGELLTQTKAALLHGEWVGWLKENVAFDVRTAQRYMGVYQQRDQFKNDSVSHLIDAYDKLSKLKKEKEQPLQVYPPAKPFVYDGYEHRIKPAYFGGYLVSINDGEYHNMGDTHAHAALLAREAIDVCSGRNLDLIRATGEGMVGFEIMSEATKTTKRAKVVNPWPAQDPKEIMYAATIAAETVKVKTPLEQLEFWWAKANPEEKRIFAEEIADAHASQLS